MAETRGMSTMLALSATLHDRAGKEFVARVRGTLAGRLACMLDQMLYDTYDVTPIDGMDKGHTCVRMPLKVKLGTRDGDSPHDEALGVNAATREIDSRRLLRNIFHFLEGTAFAEVISKS